MASVTHYAAAFTMLFSYARPEQPITCEAGHFTAGEKATVTCNFHRNMEDNKEHIYVVHYPFNASEEFSGNDALLCFRQQNWTCRVKDGYHFNNKISATLTVTIPHVKPDHAGNYICQIVPPDGRSATTCNLTVGADVTSSKQFSSVANLGPPSVGDHNRYHTIILALSVVLAFLAGVNVACVITVMIIRKCAKKRRRLSFLPKELERGKGDGDTTNESSQVRLLTNAQSGTPVTDNDKGQTSTVIVHCSGYHCQSSSARSSKAPDYLTSCEQQKVEGHDQTSFKLQTSCEKQTSETHDQTSCETQTLCGTQTSETRDQTSCKHQPSYEQQTTEVHDETSCETQTLADVHQNTPMIPGEDADSQAAPEKTPPSPQMLWGVLFVREIGQMCNIL